MLHRSRESWRIFMPLSEPVERELLHTRNIRVQGYRRSDGLFDIEAHLTDFRNQPFTTPDRGTIPVGEALHEMWMRITIDSAMLITACTASTEFAPFTICPGGAENFAGLAGLTIKSGFLKAANERIGGVSGCTHLRELLQQMATIAFQTVWSVRKKPEADPQTTDGAARLLNTCHAYASDGPVVRRRWPLLYTGPADDVASSQMTEPASPNA
jgi:hypothetical protein